MDCIRVAIKYAVLLYLLSGRWVPAEGVAAQTCHSPALMSARLSGRPRMMTPWKRRLRAAAGSALGCRKSAGREHTGQKVENRHFTPVQATWTIRVDIEFCRMRPRATWGRLRQQNCLHLYSPQSSAKSSDTVALSDDAPAGSATANTCEIPGTTDAVPLLECKALFHPRIMC